MKSKTLIIGACGQIGSELTHKLRAKLGVNNVIASDIKARNLDLVASGPFEIIDAKNKKQLKNCIEKYEIEARDTKLGKEEITREIPHVSEEGRRYLDEKGIIIPGAEVFEGDILVGKVENGTRFFLNQVPTDIF